MPEDGDVITSFIFRVRNVPAALYKALGGFATNNVNMTKLESYQPNGFLATQFYADIEGHPEDVPVRLALEELNFYCSQMDILGVYKAAPDARRFARRLIYSKLTLAVCKSLHQLMRNRHARRNPDGPVAVHCAAYIFAAYPACFFQFLIVQRDVAAGSLCQTPDHH